MRRTDAQRRNARAVRDKHSKRLFGLEGLARSAVVSPPDPGRGRGRPPLIIEPPALPPVPLRPLTRIERQRFDWSELEASTACADQVTRDTKRALDGLLRGRARKSAAAMSPEDEAVLEWPARAGTPDQPRRGRQRRLHGCRNATTNAPDEPTRPMPIPNFTNDGVLLPFLETGPGRSSSVHVVL